MERMDLAALIGVDDLNRRERNGLSRSRELDEKIRFNLKMGRGDRYLSQRRQVHQSEATLRIGKRLACEP